MAFPEDARIDPAAILKREAALASEAAAAVDAPRTIEVARDPDPDSVEAAAAPFSRARPSTAAAETADWNNLASETALPTAREVDTMNVPEDPTDLVTVGAAPTPETTDLATALLTAEVAAEVAAIDLTGDFLVEGVAETPASCCLDACRAAAVVPRTDADLPRAAALATDGPATAATVLLRDVALVTADATDAVKADATDASRACEDAGDTTDVVDVFLTICRPPWAVAATPACAGFRASSRMTTAMSATLACAGFRASSRMTVAATVDPAPFPTAAATVRIGVAPTTAETPTP